MKNISIQELLKLNLSNNLIDIRDNYQFNLGNIPNSINIPYNFLIMNPENYLDKGKKYYLYCGYGSKSRVACEKIVLKGYDVVNVLGGYNDYLLLVHKK